MPLPEEHAALLPEDLRSSPAMEKFNDLGSLAKSYVELEKLNGDAAVLRPPKDADDAKMTEWRNSVTPKLKELGFIDSAPESPDKYDFKIDGVEQERIVGDALLKEFRGVAHQLGLSNAKANALVKHFADKIVPGINEEFAKQWNLKFPTEEQIKEELSKEFGAELHGKLAVARKGVNNMESILPGFKAWLEDPTRGRLGNDPMFVKAMALIGAMQEQDFGGYLGSLETGDTMESVEAKIAEIRANKDNLSQDKVTELLDHWYKKKYALTKMKEGGQ